MAVEKVTWLLLFTLICYLSAISAQTKKADDEFLECYLKDKTKLENCATVFLDKIYAILKTGDPSLNIPLGEPLIIKQMRWTINGPSFNIDSFLGNYKLWGWSNSKTTAVAIDKLARTISFNMSTPTVRVLSDISVNGSVLSLPIKGHGKIAINATNLNSYVKADVVQRGPGIKLQNLKGKLELKNVTFKFIETDTTDPIWEAMTKILTENIELVLEDVLPAASAKLSEITQEMANGASKKMPAEAFIA